MSIAKRHANMLARLSGIITMVNAFERKDESKSVLCSEEDFRISLELIQHSFENALRLFKELPGEQVEEPEDLLKVYDRLPGVFETSEVTNLQKPLSKSKRTLERSLKRLVDLKWIEPVKKGRYRKLRVADMT